MIVLYLTVVLTPFRCRPWRLQRFNSGVVGPWSMGCGAGQCAKRGSADVGFPERRRAAAVGLQCRRSR